MRWGICTSLEHAVAVDGAGWDYIEPSAQQVLQGNTPDSMWTGLADARLSPLPVPACNMLVPGSMKITGPEVDRAALAGYMQHVIRRAHAIGCHTLVFGSGAARRAPDGFDFEKAQSQVVDFLKSAAPLANQFQVTIVVEPLNRAECNLINRVSHAMRIIERVAHPNVRLLFDSYHAWVEEDSLDALEDAIPYLRHVHLADEKDRLPPGESGESDYRPLFAILKRHGYRGLISVESPGFDIVKAGDRVFDYLNEQMRDA